jgi:hypothetical protein
MEWFHWLGLIFVWVYHPYHDSHRYKTVKLPIWLGLGADGQDLLREQDNEEERNSKIVKGFGLFVTGLIFLPWANIYEYYYPLGLLVWFVGHSITFDQLWYYFTYKKFMPFKKWYATLEIRRKGPMNDLIKKIFRNKMDYWHFFGPLVVFGATGFFIHPVFYIIGCLTVFLWEVWDTHKISYKEGVERGYNWLQLMLRTSDRKFDAHDMFLGLAAIALWMIADAICFTIG